MTKEERALRNSNDPVAALAVADRLEEQGADPAEIERWRLYGEWHRTLMEQVVAVEKRWPALLKRRGALRTISSQERRSIYFRLPGGPRANIHAAFRFISFTLYWGNGSLRTYDFHRRCLADPKKRDRYLRVRARGMVDDWLSRNDPV